MRTPRTAHESVRVRVVLNMLFPSAPAGALDHSVLRLHLVRVNRRDGRLRFVEKFDGVIHALARNEKHFRVQVNLGACELVLYV